MKKKYFFILAIIIILSLCSIGMYDSLENYDIVNVGSGHMMIPGKSEDYEITVNDNYSIAKSDKCTLVGLDLSVGEIDSSVLGEMNVSKSDLLKIAQIESEKDMQKILCISDEEVVDMDHINRPSFKQYMIRYKCNKCETMIATHESNGKKLILIAETRKEEFSYKQYEKLFTGLSY